jgi:nucleoside-diphosphate-sugar epimerase
MILVTGGSGFLGKLVCENLHETGHAVINASISVQKDTPYPSLKVDIANAESVETLFKSFPIKKIIHLAAMLHTESWKKPSEAYMVNVQGSRNLLELSRKYGVTRFVFGSTVDALGFHSIEEGPVGENAQILPTDFYGETKRFIEKLGLAYRQIYGLEFIIDRIPFIVGPGDAIPTSAWRMEIFNLLVSGGEIDLGFVPDAPIPVSHVLDSALETIVLATAESVPHDTYHLPNESIKMKDLARFVKKLCDKIDIKYGPKKPDFYPTSVDASRFNQDFHFEHTSLFTRLEQHKKFLENQ